jgi:hypothetical protein
MWLSRFPTAAIPDFYLRLQETIVYTIGELGKEAEGDLLLVVIVSLLETLLSKKKIISSLAFTQVVRDDSDGVGGVVCCLTLSSRLSRFVP